MEFLKFGINDYFVVMSQTDNGFLATENRQANGDATDTKPNFLKFFHIADDYYVVANLQTGYTLNWGKVGVRTDVMPPLPKYGLIFDDANTSDSDLLVVRPLWSKEKSNYALEVESHNGYIMPDGDTISIKPLDGVEANMAVWRSGYFNAGGPGGAPYIPINVPALPADEKNIQGPIIAPDDFSDNENPPTDFPDLNTHIVTASKYVPYFLAEDPTMTSPAERIRKSPYYVMKQFSHYHRIGKCNNSTGKGEATLSGSTTVGISKSESKAFSAKVGVSITESVEASAGIEGIAQVKESFSGTISTEFGYTVVHGTTESKSHTFSRTYSVPPNTVAAMYSLRNTYKLFQLKGTEAVSHWPDTIGLNEDLYTTTYPEGAVLKEQKK